MGYRERSEKFSVRDKDGRQKKSWREVDQRKEGSSGRREEEAPGEGGSSHRGNTAAYQNYKKELEQLFTTGVAPKVMKEEVKALKEIKLKKEVEGEEGGENVFALLEAIKQAENGKVVVEALDAYLVGRERFPSDYEILARALEHPEPKVIRLALTGLGDLMAVQPLEHRQQFLLKLDSIGMLCDDDEVSELAREIAGRIRK